MIYKENFSIDCKDTSLNDISNSNEFINPFKDEGIDFLKNLDNQYEEYKENEDDEVIEYSSPDSEFFDKFDDFVNNFQDDSIFDELSRENNDKLDSNLISSEDFYKILDIYMKKTNINLRKFCNMIGCTENEYNRNKKNNQLPTLQVIERIANLLQIPINSLVYNKINKKYDLETVKIMAKVLFEYIYDIEEFLENQRKKINILLKDIFPTLTDAFYDDSFFKDLKFPNQKFYKLSDYLSALDEFPFNIK